MHYGKFDAAQATGQKGSTPVYRLSLKDRQEIPSHCSLEVYRVNSHPRPGKWSVDHLGHLRQGADRHLELTLRKEDCVCLVAINSGAPVSFEATVGPKLEVELELADFDPKDPRICIRPAKLAGKPPHRFRWYNSKGFMGCTDKELKVPFRTGGKQETYVCSVSDSRDMVGEGRFTVEPVRLVFEDFNKQALQQRLKDIDPVGHYEFRWNLGMRGTVPNGRYIARIDYSSKPTPFYMVARAEGGRAGIFASLIPVPHFCAFKATFTICDLKKRPIQGIESVSVQASHSRKTSLANQNDRNQGLTYCKTKGCDY
jgi:hypothetical protein